MYRGGIAQTRDIHMLKENTRLQISNDSCIWVHLCTLEILNFCRLIKGRNLKPPLSSLGVISEASRSIDG